MNLFSIFKKKILSPATLVAIKEKIDTKLYFLESLKDPQFTKDISEESIKFMVNTTKYDLHCLETDFKKFSP